MRDLQQLAARSCPYLHYSRAVGMPYGLVLAYADYVGKRSPSTWTATELDAVRTLPGTVKIDITDLVRLEDERRTAARTAARTAPAA